MSQNIYCERNVVQKIVHSSRYVQTKEGGGLSHLSVSINYLPHTFQVDEKKDESPRLSFLLPAVGL